jgi:hypothetical protein
MLGERFIWFVTMGGFIRPRLPGSGFAMVSKTSRPDRGVLVASILSEPEFNRTAMGPSQKHRGVVYVNGRRNKRGFIFDHDDVHKNAA